MSRRLPDRHFIEKVLKRWIRNILRYAEFHKHGRHHDVHDAAYMYNERGNVSLLAGAAWSEGGVALEEFWSRRRKRKGSALKKLSWTDLYISSKRCGFACEAKTLWPTKRSRKRKQAGRIIKALQRATEEAGDLLGTNCYPLGVLFVIPRVYLPARSDRKAEVPKFAQQLVREVTNIRPDAFAFVFPRRGRYWVIRSGNGKYYYPGVVTIIRRA